MANRIPNSPVTLESDRAAWRSIPEVPIAVEDGFGPKAMAVLHRDRWRALVPRGGQHVFAWLDGRKAQATGVTTRVTYGQILESDDRGRALVIGGAGESLYAVEPSGHATCLGVLSGDSKIRTACWLPRGGVALALGHDICIYTPGPDGRLLPRLRFVCVHSEISGLRTLPCDDDDFVIASIYDDQGAIYAIGQDARVHTLAHFEKLGMVDVQLFLDETGYRTMLPDGATISSEGDLMRIGGLAEALAQREQLPMPELSFDPAPDFEPGPDIAAPESGPLELEVPSGPLPDAHVEPSLDRLGQLSAALIRMLRGGSKRSSPDLEVLKLIRSNTPTDLRAYLHAWAMYTPGGTTVYEFWMDRPRLETHEFVREHAGESVRLGIFASGEPIVARLTGVGSCEVVMIDEEGQPYRYRGLEGFLLDLQMRADGSFELDDWVE